MERKITTKKVKAVQFIASWEMQSGLSKKLWAQNYFTLMDYHITLDSIVKLEMRQGGRLPNGFYPNYVYMLVDENKKNFFEELMESLGYSFTIETVDIMKVTIPYDSNDFVSDYIIEEGF